ncbi:unnamed protein product, partial [marine sediment metagenome]
MGKETKRNIKLDLIKQVAKLKMDIWQNNIYPDILNTDMECVVNDLLGIVENCFTILNSRIDEVENKYV